MSALVDTLQREPLPGEPFAPACDEAIAAWLRAHFVARPFTLAIGRALAHLRDEVAVSIESQQIAAELYGERFLRDMFAAHDHGRVVFGERFDAIVAWVRTHAPSVSQRTLAELAVEVERCGENLNRWLRTVLRYTAHGLDFEIPHSARVHIEQEVSMLERWERVKFITRGAFDPDWSQRAFALVSASSKMSKAQRDRMVHAAHSVTHTAYWWLPGPNASLALEVLPPLRGLVGGDTVRYTRSFVRSLGGDEDSRNWSAIVVELVNLNPRSNKPPRFALVDEGGPEEPCSSCEPGETRLECRRCRGKGRTHLRLINLANIERLPARRGARVS